MKNETWGVIFLFIFLGIGILIGFLLFMATNIYAESDDILPQFPDERIMCHTYELEFSKYRCYSVALNISEGIPFP